MNLNINVTMTCTVSNNIATLSMNGNYQKVEFTFNPKNAFELKYYEFNEKYA